MVEYEISSEGVRIGEPLREFRGLMTSVPGPWLLEASELPQLRPSKSKPQPSRAAKKRRKRESP